MNMQQAGGHRLGRVEWPGVARAIRPAGPVAPSAPLALLTLLALLAGGAGLLAGCTSAAAAGAGPGASCGTTRTAANVPVIIKVVKGTVNCGAALQVENEYAAKIRDGQVRGNGGGAPVAVGAWTCQGYPTPEVLSTGNASQCHTGSAAIVAVLPVASPATTG
jgi:hypothetical protein